VSTSSQRSGWDYATGMAEQWSGSTAYSSTMSFLEQHDPFPSGFEVELTRAGSRLPGAIVGRLRLGRWQVVLENGSEVEADLLDLTPRTPVMTAGHSRGLVVGAPQLVCVDSMEENMVPAMALRAHAVLGETWNGWARPIASAKQMGDFLRRWRANDPNGVWGFAVELDEALLVTRGDGEDPDYFGTAGFDVDGSPLYDLTGWVWVVIPG
jgi:hypothetical protein